jgi:hypothetical protein
MVRLGIALFLTTLIATSAFARNGAMGHGGMARGDGFSQPLLPAPSIDNSSPALTGPSGPPPSSLSSSLGSSAGTLYPNQMNSLSSINAGR